MAAAIAPSGAVGINTKPKTAAPRSDHSDYTPAVRWTILIAVLLGTIMEVLDTSIVNVAIPEMMGNLGATLDQIGWVSTGYIVANVIVLPLTGWLSSRFGRRNYLAGSMILFTIASIFCGTSRSLNALVFFRILQGAGGAALLSTAQATLREIFPPEQQGAVTGLFSLGVVVAPTLGPTLGGLITDNYSWPWIFFINVPIGIIATALTLLFLRDSKYQNPNASRVDIPGIALLAIGLGCFQTVLEKGNREDWFESGLILGLTVAGTLGLSLFIWWELRAKAPAVDLRILKNRGFTSGIVFAFVLGFGLYGGVFIIPVFLQELRHFNAEQTGLVLLPGGLATAVMAIVNGRLSGKLNPRIPLLFGTVLFIISMFMLHNVTMDTGAEHLLMPLILRGAGLGCLFVPLTLITLDSLAPREIAAGAGLFNLMRQLGGSVGIAFLSTMIDHRTNSHRAYLVENINSYSLAATQRLAQLQQSLMSKGAPLDVARRQAYQILDNTIQGQASLLAFEDAFLMIGIAFVLTTPLILLFKKKKKAGNVDMSAVH